MGYNKNKCTELLSQVRKYKLQKHPYNLLYGFDDTPLIWWNTCYDGKNYLQNFAIKLFSIIPSSTSCERIFSTLGWMVGKRRQNLSIENLESMAKIHRYLITNSKNELSYLKNTYSNNEVLDLINNAYSLLEQDFEEEDENIENLDDNFENELTFDFNNNNRYILSIDEIIDLKNQLLVREPLIIIENQEIDEENSENEVEDYNPEDLIEDILNSD